MKIKSFISGLVKDGKVLLHQVNFVTADRQDFWCLMLAPAFQINALKSRFHEKPRLSDFGTILYSGYGDAPPEYIMDKCLAYDQK
jgi:hypothetical protein